MTSGNPILDKNLEFIGQYNPTLKDKILNLPFLTNKIDLVETEAKEPNLLFNEFPLHSQEGAEAEAKKIFMMSEETPSCINIIFGMGLGYLFKEFSEHSKGHVIVYEPNLEILRVSLELVDFSQELSKNNVKITSDSNELKQALCSFYKFKSEVYFLYLDSYKMLYEKDIPQIISEIEILKQICQEDFTMLRNKGLIFVSSVLDNLASSLNTVPLGEFKDLYKGKTALIVSAGPTLDMNIETIKKNRDKFVIFCVGTAFKPLVKNDIKVDFLIVAEMVDCSSQIEGLDISDIKFIVAPYTHKSVFNLKSKQKFIFPSVATRGAKYWAHLTEMDISGYLAKGTVSHTALASAKMLGFENLILVGQDLAFINNARYTKDSVYSNFVLEKNPVTGKIEYNFKDFDEFINYVHTVYPNAKVEDLRKECKDEDKDNLLAFFNAKLAYVKGISGEMLPTDIGYAMFVGVFEEFASENSNLNLINTSMLGAQIDGFKNMPLKQALEPAETIQEVDFLTDFKFDKKLVIKNLDADKEALEKALKKFVKAKEHCTRFEREIKRRSSVTKDAEKDYIALLRIYDEVTVEFFEKNQLYKIISATESLDLKYYADTSKEQGEARVRTLFGFLKKYFHDVEVKILMVLNKITEQRDIINESINTES